MVVIKLRERLQNLPLRSVNKRNPLKGQQSGEAPVQVKRAQRKGQQVMH
jgi:hypothetical protein